MTTYTARFEIEVQAGTPQQAATIARDIMLDPDAQISVDVHSMEYVDAADSWFPIEKQGWYAWFDGSVRPENFFAWERVR
jgi:hypothetical protein